MRGVPVSERLRQVLLELVAPGLGDPHYGGRLETCGGRVYVQSWHLEGHL
jgi:hypothetical protein